MGRPDPEGVVRAPGGVGLGGGAELAQGALDAAVDGGGVGAGAVASLLEGEVLEVVHLDAVALALGEGFGHAFADPGEEPGAVLGPLGGAAGLFGAFLPEAAGGVAFVEELGADVDGAVSDAGGHGLLPWAAAGRGRDCPGGAVARVFAG